MTYSSPTQQFALTPDSRSSDKPDKTVVTLGPQAIKGAATLAGENFYHRPITQSLYVHIDILRDRVRKSTGLN